MKRLRDGVMVMFLSWVSSCQMALAQTDTQEKTAEQFDGLAAFIVKIMTGPASKILALVFLIAGIWKIVHKDYGAAIGCILALLALVFMPQFLKIF